LWYTPREIPFEGEEQIKAGEETDTNTIRIIFNKELDDSTDDQQRETRACMMFSGILIDIRLTFNKEKRGHV